MARDLEKLRGRRNSGDSELASWASGKRSSWGRGVVECVRPCPCRGWSLLGTGEFDIGSAGRWMGPSGRPAGGGKRTRTQPHVLARPTGPT